MSGFEIRRDRMQPLVWLGRDRERFPEFFAKEMPNAISGAPTEVCVGPIEYRGQAAMRRDIENFKDALKDVQVTEAFLPVVAPASTAYNGINEYYPSEKEYVYAIADALKHEYKAILDAGLLVQVDDAVLANMYDHLVQTSPEHYRKWAPASDRRAEPRAGGDPRGPGPLPRLLRELARAAHRGRAAGGADRPDPPGARPAPTRSRRRTRATSTSGGSGRRRSSETARS